MKFQTCILINFEQTHRRMDLQAESNGGIIILWKMLPVTPLNTQLAVPYLLYQYVWKKHQDAKCQL